jgi:carbon starvation protein
MHANAAVVSLIAFAALGLAYVVYGRYLARHIFKLSDTRQTPANEFEDGVDYVPTGVPILFGHHFASIAGLGPILGPVIASGNAEPDPEAICDTIAGETANHA